jgi:hypothetical protein
LLAAQAHASGRGGDLGDQLANSANRATVAHDIVISVSIAEEPPQPVVLGE